MSKCGGRIKTVCTECINFINNGTGCIDHQICFKEGDGGENRYILQFPSDKPDTNDILCATQVTPDECECFGCVVCLQWAKIGIQRDSIYIAQTCILACADDEDDNVIAEVPWNSNVGCPNEFHNKITLSGIVNTPGVGTGNIKISIDLPDGGTLDVTVAVEPGDSDVPLCDCAEVDAPDTVKCLKVRISKDFVGECDTELCGIIVYFEGPQRKTFS